MGGIVACVSPVWLNGEMVDPDAAKVAVMDHGLTVGDGVFETLRTERGVPLAMTRHIARLRRSLAGLGLELGRSDDELREAMVGIASHFDGPAKVRLTVTAGTGPIGSGRELSDMTTYVVGAALDPWPHTTSAITVPWRRNEHSPVAGLKTTSYAENVVALRAAHEAGAEEAILANTAGNLCEGTGTNVFVVVDGELITPPLSAGCLAGITRELVIETSDVSVRDVPFEILEVAKEVFVTSSTRDVQPLHRLDDRELDAPGPVTTRAEKAFAELVASNVDP